MAIHLARPVAISPLARPHAEASSSSSSSASLTSLRSALVAASRQLGPARPNPNRSQADTIVPRDVVSALLGGQDEDEDEDDEQLNELIISRSGQSVDWVRHPTRGAETRVRTWNYSTLGESVSSAKFVRFLVDPHEDDKHDDDGRRPSSSSSNNNSGTTTTDVWGPYRRERERTARGGGQRREGTNNDPRREWSDEVLKLPTEPPFPTEPRPPIDVVENPSDSSSSSLSYRTYLLVVLSTVAFLEPVSSSSSPSSQTRSSRHNRTQTRRPLSEPPQDSDSNSNDDDEPPEETTHGGGGGGGGVPIHLPFKVANVYPLDPAGVLFERAAAASQGNRDALSSSSSSSSSSSEFHPHHQHQHGQHRRRLRRRRRRQNDGVEKPQDNHDEREDQEGDKGEEEVEVEERPPHDEDDDDDDDDDEAKVPVWWTLGATTAGVYGQLEPVLVYDDHLFDFGEGGGGGANSPPSTTKKTHHFGRPSRSGGGGSGVGTRDEVVGNDEEEGNDEETGRRADATKTTRRRRGGGSGRTMTNLDERFVFVSSSGPGSGSSSRLSGQGGGGASRGRVGVSVDEKKRKVTVWGYGEAMTSRGGEGNNAAREDGQGRRRGDRDGARGMQSARAEPFAAMTTDPADKVRRRMSRRSRGGGGGPAGELDFSHQQRYMDLASTTTAGRGEGSRRRSARLSRHAGLAHDTTTMLEADLLAALNQSNTTSASLLLDSRPPPLQSPLAGPPGPPPSSSTNLRRSHHTGTSQDHHHHHFPLHPVSPEHRRTSLTRNDLSVTMDRMALSQGSSLGGNGGGGGGGGGMSSSIHGPLGFGPPGPEGGETLDREATMYLDEGEWVNRVEGGEPSEYEFTAVWQGDLDGTSAKGIRVELFDQRSSVTATLSILLPEAKTLLLLSLSFDPKTTALVECVPFRQVASVKSACTVEATRHDERIRDLLVLDDSGQLRLVAAHGIELDVVVSAARCSKDDEPVEELRSNGGRCVTLSLNRGRKRQLTSVVRSDRNRDGLEDKVLRVLAQVLGVEQFAQLLTRVFDERQGHGDGQGFERVRHNLEQLFGVDRTTAGRQTHMAPDQCDSAFLGRLRRPPARPSPAPSLLTIEMTPAHCAILLSLHLLVQSLRLRTSTMPQASELATLVALLGRAIGATGWVDDYRRTWGPDIAGFGQSLLTSPTVTPPALFPKTPPNVVTHLSNLLTCSPAPDSTRFTLASVASRFSSDPPSFFYGLTSSPLSTLSNLIDIYTLLAPASSPVEDTPTQRAHRAVIRFHELGYTTDTLEDMPFGISLPIREAIRACQLDPPELSLGSSRQRWAGIWDLVGRSELERSDRYKEGEKDTRVRRCHQDAPIDIDSAVRRVEVALSPAGSTGNKAGVAALHEREQDEPNLNPIPRAARFNEDKRMDEVARMLQYVEPVVIAPGEKTLDQLTPQAQQSILSALSHRTMALPVGAAMYHLGTARPTGSDSLEIPKINTSARIIPMPSPVALAEKERDPATVTVPERSEWPDFHSGVAAGLRIDFDRAKPIDSSELSFNRPTDLDARHAGLLLGLGLGGQLGSMRTSQAYDYLKAKHDPTSVAILLGLAVTYLGTSDATVTSVISIHLPALHPPRSSSLNVSGMTKSAAAVSLGLLHFASGRRSLADVLLRELCEIKVTNVEDAAACREAYALSCGFAFGYIMLGRGSPAGTARTASAQNEVDLLRVFRALILGEDNRPLPGAFYPSHAAHQPIDVNMTTSAATVALALMFVRTERRDVADVFEIPDSPRRLDYVRPDVLLLRALGQSLVMWDAVAPSKDWIESSLPPFVAKLDPAKPIDPDYDVARWSVIAGACFALGFKFAGTATAEAHAALIHYMDRLTRACYVKATTVQSKIKRHSLRTCLGVVSIALAMVMAGTGELNVLRRLRVAHGHFSEGLTYGYHLSTHMALGLLFLGEAKYTLSNSNGAIATLLLALYPIFPSNSTDNRAHLQAYRHLWALAAEPRYLEARDIDSDEPVFLPIRLRLVDQNQSTNVAGAKAEIKTKQLVAPTLIPDVRTLHSIQVESPRYWGFTIRLDSNPDQFSRFLRDNTIYVKRRTGHLSYAQDPRGIRSIFTRSKSETGSAVYDFGETTRVLNPSATGLREFVAAFSSDPGAIAATERLCVPPADDGLNDGDDDDARRLPSEFEAFCASVLLECLTKDKRDVSSVYHSMFHAQALLSPAVATPALAAAALLAYEQLRLVVDFYHRGTFKALFGGGGGGGGGSRPKSTSSSSIASSSSPTPSGGSSVREPLINPAFIDHVSSTLASRFGPCHHTSSSSSSSSILSDDDGDDLVLSNYLASPPGTWPRVGSLSTRLALALAHESVPDLAALEQLDQLVRDAKEQSRRGGGDTIAARTEAEAKAAEEAAERQVEVLVKCTAKTLESQGKKAWSNRVSYLLSRN